MKEVQKQEKLVYENIADSKETNDKNIQTEEFIEKRSDVASKNEERTNTSPEEKVYGKIVTNTAEIVDDRDNAAEDNAEMGSNQVEFHLHKDE